MATSSYQEWADALAQWADGATVDLSTMPPPGDLPPEVVDRLRHRVLSAIVQRAQSSGTAMAGTLSTVDDTAGFTAWIATLAQKTRALRAPADACPLPQAIRQEASLLADQVAQARWDALDRLVDDLRRDGAPGELVEAHRRIVREHRPPAASGPTAETVASTSEGGRAVPWSTGSSPHRRRLERDEDRL